MDIKKLLKKEAPTLDYYKKLDKFVYYIACLSVIINCIAGAITSSIYDLNGNIFMFMAFLSAAVYMLYANYSVGIRNKIKIAG